MQIPISQFNSNFDPGLPHKRGWPDLLHSGSNLFNSHSPSRSILCILLHQTNTPALLLHLHFPCLPRSSLLPLALHFKLQCFSQNMPIIPPQHILVPSLLPSEPPFPSIPTSPLGPLSSFSSLVLHHTLFSPWLSQSFSKFPSDRKSVV